MRLMLIAGTTGSGKTTITNFAKDMGIPTVRMGDMTLMKAKQRNFDWECLNLLRLADHYRKTMGEAYCAKLTNQFLQENFPQADWVVVDGIRSMAEYDEFARVTGSPYVLAVTAPEEIRYTRYVIRNRNDDFISREAFAERNKTELEWGLQAVLDNANATIENENKSKEEIGQRFKDIIEKIMGKQLDALSCQGGGPR